MKYVLMYTSDHELSAAVPPERQQEVNQAVWAWFQKYDSSFLHSGAELQAPGTATTVTSDPDGTPVVVDGPFAEAKETIGGFSIIDVPDLDAALAMAREWPPLGTPGVSVEIRPIVDHSGGM